MLLGVQDKKCLKCGKLLNNQQIRKNAEFCSKQCANSSQLLKIRRNKTILQKYGVQNVSQSQTIKQKKVQSYLKHYGVTRYQCQKHKLKELLGQKFNPQLSESQNMYLNGFNKIYDCGNMVFVKPY